MDLRAFGRSERSTVTTSGVAVTCKGGSGGRASALLPKEKKKSRKEERATHVWRRVVVTWRTADATRVH
jgi:hypothetical protein